MDLWQEMLQTLCLTGGQWTADPSVFVKFPRSAFVLLSLSGFICKYRHSLQGGAREIGFAFRNKAQAFAYFAKWIVPFFQNCIIISFKSNTGFRENICFYHDATDMVLFSQCGWDREVPIQRSLTQFWQFMGSTSWTGSGKDMKTKSTKEKCNNRKESEEDLPGKRLLNHNERL